MPHPEEISEINVTILDLKDTGVIKLSRLHLTDLFGSCKRKWILKNDYGL